MAATPLTVNAQADPTTAVATADYVAGDHTNGNTFVNTGNERIVAVNTDVASQTLACVSTDTLTNHTVTIASGDVAVLEFPLAVWGAAPVLTPSTTTVKLLALDATPTAVQIEALVTSGEIDVAVPAATAATSIADLQALAKALRDSGGATSYEKRVYRRIVHACDVAQKRLTGHAPSGSGADRL